MDVDLLNASVTWWAVLLATLALVGGTWLSIWRLRRGWLQVVKNALAILLASALIQTAIFLELNRRNAWFPSVGDLVGRPAEVQDAHVGARTSGKTFGKLKLTRTDERVLPALPQPRQRMQHFRVPTSRGSRSWPVDVLLPAGYFDPANAHRAYPVVVALHGVPGSLSAWTGRMSVTGLTDPVVQQGKVAPFITVMPEVTPSAMDTECQLGPDGPDQMETWLAKDVPNHVSARLRVIPQRQAWATAGYSAGGWCAAVLPLLHPQRYGAGIVLGGYFKPWWGNARPPAASAAQLAERLDLAAVAHRSRPSVALYVQTAKDDPNSWPTTKIFLTRVKAPTMVTAEINAHGGHTFGLWTGGFTRGVTWLGSTVPGFRP